MNDEDVAVVDKAAKLVKRSRSNFMQWSSLIKAKELLEASERGESNEI